MRAAGREPNSIRFATPKTRPLPDRNASMWNASLPK